MLMGFGFLLFLIGALMFRICSAPPYTERSIKLCYLSEINMCLGLLLIIIGYSLMGGC